MNDTTDTLLTRPLRIATLLMAAAVMVGGMGCVTTMLLDSARHAAKQREWKARNAEMERAKNQKPTELPAQPE